MTERSNSSTGFQGARVLALESRRAREIAQLIAHNGGEPMVAPATREIPAEDNGDALKFLSELREGRVDMVVFLTGVGVRALAQAVEKECLREELVAALSRTTVIARGPKPVAALRELGVPIAEVVPEPNTWRELLGMLDEGASAIPVRGRRVAVQEYGVSSPELLGGLAERGAEVMPVRIYEWSLPEDVAPLQEAVRAVVRGEIEVLLVTAGVQIRHFFLVAEKMAQAAELAEGLKRVAVASIGPVTSAELRGHGIEPEMEPTHPKMGFLVQEMAQRWALRKGRAET